MWMNQNLLAVFHQSNENILPGTNTYTETLFKYFHIPAADWIADDYYDTGWTFSKEILCKLILWRYGEQCSIIGDPDNMAEAIDIWSYSNMNTWQALYKSIFLKYNPLRTLDYTIAETGTTSKRGSNTNTGNRAENGIEIHDNTDTYDDTITTDTDYGKNETVSGSDTHTGQENNTGKISTETDNTTTESITAYNEDTFTDAKKSVLDGESHTDSASTKVNTDTNIKSTNTANSGTDTETKAHTGTIDYDRNINRSNTTVDTETGVHAENGESTNNRTFTGMVLKGDIMSALISWREYRNLNLYDIIAIEFAKEFLIMIW